MSEKEAGKWEPEKRMGAFQVIHKFDFMELLFRELLQKFDNTFY